MHVVVMKSGYLRVDRIFKNTDGTNKNKSGFRDEFARKVVGDPMQVSKTVWEIDASCH